MNALRRRGPQSPRPANTDPRPAPPAPAAGWAACTFTACAANSLAADGGASPPPAGSVRLLLGTVRHSRSGLPTCVAGSQEPGAAFRMGNDAPHRVPNFSDELTTKAFGLLFVEPGSRNQFFLRLRVEDGPSPRSDP